MAERQIFHLPAARGSQQSSMETSSASRQGRGHSIPEFVTDTAAEAAAWCVATAAVHQGKPNQYSHVEHWEVRNRLFHHHQPNRIRRLQTGQVPRLGGFRPCSGDGIRRKVSKP